jgi:putative MATE family efflux protein
MKLPFDGTLGRRIVRLSAPVVAAMITQTLINVADQIMVGRLPAAESIPGQAAVANAVTLLWAIGGSLSAIAVGTQALTARRYGSSDLEGAGRVLTNSIAISATLGLIASLSFYKLAPRLFPLINPAPSAVALGVPFLQWRYLAVMSMAVTSSYKSFFDGLGRTHVHFVVAFIMNALNLVLGICLIFGKLGLPRMGVPGAGLASCISSYVGMVLIIAWTFRKDVRRFHSYAVSKLDRRVMWEIARLSAPSAAAVVVSLFGFAVFYRVVATLDQDAHNAATIYSTATGDLISILMLVFISCMAYGTAVATLVGQSMGARDFNLAERYAYEAAKIGFAVFAVLGVFTAAFPTVILHIVSKDAEVIATAAPILRVLGLFQPVMSIALVFTYALYGAGNSFFVMLVELTLHLSCLIPVSILLGLKLGLGMWGVWGAMIAYVVLMAVIMSAKFSAGSWKHIEI